MQIFVLGMHRSGTSAVTRLISLMGVTLGSPEAGIGANAENPKGFWERRDVIDLNEALLAECSASWHSPLSFSLESIASAKLSALREQAETIISSLPSDSPWVIKDPRLCLTAPFWTALVPKPLVVFVYRDPIEVAASLQKRNGFDLSHGLGLWELYSRAALSAQPKIPVIKVSFNRVMQDSEGETDRLYKALLKSGLDTLTPPNKAEVEEFIDASLYRNRSSDTDLSGILTQPQLELFRAIESKDVVVPEQDNSRGTIHALQHHQQSMDVISQIELSDPRLLTTPKVRLLKELSELQTSYQTLKTQRIELEESYDQAKGKVSELEEAYDRSQRKRTELEDSYLAAKAKREQAEEAYRRAKDKRLQAESAYESLKQGSGKQ